MSFNVCSISDVAKRYFCYIVAPEAKVSEAIWAEPELKAEPDILLLYALMNEVKKSAAWRETTVERVQKNIFQTLIGVV